MNNPETQPRVQVEEEFDTQDKIVLILCGLIASGKSTFADALQAYFPQFRRCCQDELGNRQAVENAAREFLGMGYSICIDRMNFNAGQRSHWIKIAHKFPGTLVWVIVFNTPYEVCAQRLRSRASHPTIKSAKEGLPILAHFAKDFRHPDPREGYDRILYLQPPSAPIVSGNTDLNSASLGVEPEYPTTYYTKSDISSILHRVRCSPAILPPPISSSNSTVSCSDSSASPPAHIFRGSSRGVVGSQRQGHGSSVSAGGETAGSHRGRARSGRTPHSHSSSSSRPALCDPRRDRESWRDTNYDPSEGHQVHACGRGGVGSYDTGPHPTSFAGVSAQDVTASAAVPEMSSGVHTDGDGYSLMKR